MYQHVLVGTDGSASSQRAVELAAQLAHRHDARLTIAHAFSPRPTVTVGAGALPTELDWLATPGALAEAVLQAAVDLAQQIGCGGLRVEGRAEPGATRQVLRSLIAELGPDAVVLAHADARGPLRRGGDTSLLGRSDVEVIVVGAKPTRRRGRAA